MPLRTGVRRAMCACAAVIPLSASALAQTPPPITPSADPRPVASWHVAAGADAYALRDVARTGPVDASPVAWRGRGPALLVWYTRARPTRQHRFEFSAAAASGFRYDDGLRSTARPSDDRYRRVEGRYEYRRYPWTSLLFRGFDVGVGVQAIGARASAIRHIPVDLESRESSTSAGTAVVAAARLRRWSRVTIDVAWNNGAVVGRLSSRHTADAAASRTRSGGGWLTDLSIAADIALRPPLALTVRYVDTHDGLFSSHGSSTSARSAITVGVTYAK